MHELSVVEDLLKTALRHAAQHHATRVTDLHLRLGQMSSIVDDSVQFYWDLIAADTLCAGARLHFTRVPASLLCLDCQHEFSLDREIVPCPNCGGWNLRLTGGQEFLLESIEIEAPSLEARPA